jgi:nitrite reductase (NADH) small subunit
MRVRSMDSKMTTNSATASNRSSSTSRHVVALVADLPPGERKIVTVNGREIGVFNLSGRYYALLNYCPHRAGPLCQGRLRPLVTADSVYELAYEREGEILKCPWHQWEFDITTGRALFDEKMQVKGYPVAQEGDEIVLYV